MTAPRRSIAAYVYRGPPWEVLVVKRTPTRGGMWYVVAGKVEPTDADLHAAAVREVAEETGIQDPLEVRDLGLERTFEGYDGHRYEERSFAVRVRPGAPVTRCDEHEAEAWLPFDDAIARLPFEENREAVRQLGRLTGAE